MSETNRCGLCGEPMPEGEEMFKFHGYSGPCPKPPLARPAKKSYEQLERENVELLEACKALVEARDGLVSGMAERIERATELARAALAKAQGKEGM